MPQDVVLQFKTPHVLGDEVGDEVLVQHDEFTREGSANVEIGGERLKAFVVAQDLRG